MSRVHIPMERGEIMERTYGTLEIGVVPIPARVVIATPKPLSVIPVRKQTQRRFRSN